MKEDFAGAVAVVTGAAQGIGRAIAEELGSRGARLLLVDRNAEGLAATAAEMKAAHGEEPRTLIADLADPEAPKVLLEKIKRLDPRIDVLVNNAGIELDLPFEAITAVDFDRVIAVNLRAPLLLTQALIPLFPSTGGAIVNISSVHADRAFPNAIPYACSKAGLVAQTRNLALELASRKIRVNAVCPGYIDTPMWDEWLKTMDNPEEVARHTASLHPIGRRGLPRDVASAVAYLAGPASDWVTGTCLVVDGGLTIRAHP